MADVKISALPSSTTPLAGTEVLPIVQSSTTKKVTVADLTAGRTVNATTVDATNVEVTNVKAKDGTAAITISDTSGNVGIGGTASAFSKFLITGTLPTSSNITVANYSTGTVPSGATSNAYGYYSRLGTQAASFTLSSLIHYYINPQAFGAGSTVTNQFGYYADSSLTGATNNYGFYSNIASGTNRFNFYANGTADNYFAGNVGIGTASPQTRLHIVTSSDGSQAIFSGSQSTNEQTLLFRNAYYTNNSTAGIAAIGWIDTGSSGGNLTFKTTTNGGGVSGTPTERMRIDSSGNVGIGTASLNAQDKVTIGGTLPSSSASSVGLVHRGVIPSTTTGNYGIAYSGSTEAASFTVSNSYLIAAYGTTKGAGSSIINEFGFYADSTLTQATNNYGFYSNIASGSNRWNFYAAGTAQNYFAGRVGVGTTTLNVGFEVASATTEDNRSLRVAFDTTYYYEIRNLGAGGNRLRSNNGEMLFNITGTDYARLTTAGEFITGGTTDQGAYNLQCNGTGVWGAGAYVNGSDERLKDDIATLNDGLNVVSQLRPVTFKYKPDYSKDQNVQTGFIAQELQTVLAGKDYADGVVQAGPEYLNVAYQSLIPILVKAVQELKAELDALKGNA